jgi:hypothetical protein
VSLSKYYSSSSNRPILVVVTVHFIKDCKAGSSVVHTLQGIMQHIFSRTLTCLLRTAACTFCWRLLLTYTDTHHIHIHRTSASWCLTNSHAIMPSADNARLVENMFAIEQLKRHLRIACVLLCIVMLVVKQSKSHLPCLYTTSVLSELSSKNHFHALQLFIVLLVEDDQQPRKADPRCSTELGCTL